MVVLGVVFCLGCFGDIKSGENESVKSRKIILLLVCYVIKYGYSFFED